MTKHIIILSLLITFSISAKAQSSIQRMQLREKLGVPTKVSERRDTFVRNDDTQIEITYDKDDEPCTISIIEIAEKYEGLSDEDRQKRWDLRGERLKNMVVLTNTLVPLENRGPVVKPAHKIGDAGDVESTEYEKVVIKVAQLGYTQYVTIRFRNSVCPEPFSPPRKRVVKLKSQPY